MLQQETFPLIHCEILRAYTDSDVNLDSLLLACKHAGNWNGVKTLTVDYYTLHSS